MTLSLIVLIQFQVIYSKLTILDLITLNRLYRSYEIILSYNNISLLTSTLVFTWRILLILMNYAIQPKGKKENFWVVNFSNLKKRREKGCKHLYFFEDIGLVNWFIPLKHKFPSLDVKDNSLNLAFVWTQAFLTSIMLIICGRVWAQPSFTVHETHITSN